MQILKDADFARLLKAGKGGSFVFFGAEDYLKNHYIKSARALLCPDEGLACFNDITVDFPDYSAAALENALSAPPIMCDKKLVVLRSFRFDMLKPTELDALVTVLTDYREDESNLLIISVPAGGIDEGYLPKAPSATLKKLGDVATLIRFEEPSVSKLAVWVARHLESEKVTIDPRTAAFFIDYCGKNMVCLLPEIGKLAAYAHAHGKQAVEESDITAVCVPTEELGAFALSNALLSGNRRKMLDVLSVLRQRREPPKMIMAEIARTEGDLLLCKLMIEGGATSAEVASALTKNSIYRADLYIGAVRTVSVEKLRQNAERAAAADLAMKSNGKRGYEEIEKWICFS